MLEVLPVREHDSYGCGAYRASRGGRSHNGIDYSCYEGTKIVTHVKGIVTKIGYPYADDLSYRYVQVTDPQGLRHRFFYVEPWVDLGTEVEVYSAILGTAQAVNAKYPVNEAHPLGMLNHVHYEIKLQDGSFIDPSEFINRNTLWR